MSEKFSLRVVDWRPLRKNTLVGVCAVLVVEMRMVIRDIAIHQKGSATWAQLPSKPWIKGGIAVTDDNGKVKYSPVVEFELEGPRRVQPPRDRSAARLRPARARRAGVRVMTRRCFRARGATPEGFRRTKAAAAVERAWRRSQRGTPNAIHKQHAPAVMSRGSIDDLHRREGREPEEPSCNRVMTAVGIINA
jgi:hypothetical protein